jgi:peptide/nickel transport system permease protein
MRRLKRFFSHWQNWLGAALVLLFAAVAFAAPMLSQPNKTTQGAFKKVGRSTDFTPHPPSKDAILGTLPGQLDVYHALIWGAREAMVFGVSVALGAFIFGSFFGAISGYAGGMVNDIMMRITDAFLTFPVLAGVVFLQQLVAITIESMGGIYWFNNDYRGQFIDFQFTPPAFAIFLMKVDPILISLILFSWMPIARIVNSMVITLKNTEFIQATRALGANPFWIIRRHLLPNAVGPAIVLAARDVGSSVILQATITFIGLGGASPWGILLSLGRDWVIGPGGDLLATWWVFLPATLAIVLFGLGWNLVGDGLTEALEPSAATYEKSIWADRKKRK